VLYWRGSTIRAWLGFLGVVTGAAAAGYLAYRQIEPPQKHEAEQSKTISIVAIAAMFLISVASGASRVVAAVFTSRRREAQAQSQQILKTLVWAVSDETGLDPRMLGASAWSLVGVWRFKWLYRLAREHYLSDPPPSQIWWTPGKGIIGRCVATGQKQIVNVRTIDTQLSQLVTAEEWGALPDERRMGLSFKEYEKIRGKYGTVVAMPIIDPARGHRVIGVVSLDAPTGNHGKVSRPAVVEKVGQAAASVAQWIV
jgi:hypothetical protein